MSLTSFLKIKEVKDKFRETFKKPLLKLEGAILAPPQTTNYGLVGTAFDYLMRFILEYHNPQAIKSPWVAEYVLEDLDSIPLFGDTMEELELVNDFVESVPGIIEFAKNEHKNYIEKGEVRKGLLQACIVLAQTDEFFRSRKPPKNYGNVEEGDIKDLFNLIGIFPTENFIAKDYVLLNPTFGEGSKLVGGADADIIIDGALIDIKTIKDLALGRRYFNQLVGYYILTLIGGIDGIEVTPEIKELGIYFSRYGKLIKFPVQDIIAEGELDDFIEWFVAKATDEFQTKK